MVKFSKWIVALLILGIMFNPAGCKKQEKARKKPSISTESAIPKELTKIEKDIEKIIDEAKKIKITHKTPEKAQSNEKTKDKKEQKQKPPPTEKNWQQIEKNLKDIHNDWNSLSALAMKKGAKLNLINSMSAAINDLTLVIEKKSKTDVLIYANGVYKYIPEFEKLFSDQTLTYELKKLKFYCRDIEFKSEIEKWDEISKDIVDINSTWETLRVKLPKDSKTSADKFERSIGELQKAVKLHNKLLTKIKAEVMLSTLKSLEKASKPKK